MKGTFGAYVTRRESIRGLAAIIAAGVAPNVTAGAVTGLRRGIGARMAATGGGYAGLPWKDFAVCSFDRWITYRDLVWNVKPAHWTSSWISLAGDWERGPGTVEVSGKSSASFCGNVVFDLPLCFRIVADCNLAAQQVESRVIVDNSITYCERGVCLGITSEGRWITNSKLNGNGSDSTFCPNPSPVFFDPEKSYDGIFECGVIPKDDGFCYYAKFNGGCEYYGAVLPASSFSLSPFSPVPVLFSPKTDGYGYSTGTFRSVKFQYLDTTGY